MENLSDGGVLSAPVVTARIAVASQAAGHVHWRTSRSSYISSHSLVRVGLLSLLFLVLLGCGDSNTSGRIYHPTPDAIPSPDALAHIIKYTDVASFDVEMQYIARLVGDARQVATIGADQGPRHEMMGEVRSVALSSAGDVFLLDSKHRELFVYGPTGQYRYTIGAPGEGPGEFQYPQAVYIDIRDRVFVVDRKGGRISVFASSDSTHALVSTSSVGFTPKALCVIGDQLFFSGDWPVRPNDAVHVFDLSGEHLRSFGATYSSPAAHVRALLSDGPLGCHPDSKALVYMFSRLPLLYGYEVTGGSLWTSMFGDFSPGDIIEEGRGSDSEMVLFGSGGREYDRASNVFHVTDHFFIVQTRHIIPRTTTQDKSETYHTYVVNGKTGQAMYIGTELHRILAVKSGMIVTYGRARFPQVHIHEMVNWGL